MGTIPTFKTGHFISLQYLLYVTVAIQCSPFFYSSFSMCILHNTLFTLGLAKCKWDISPTVLDLPSQCNSESSPGHGQTGEDDFGEGLVRPSVNRVLA